ncbi:glycine betaine ABC transporter substrate-binding protein [Dermacoccaceae bacterium W4C1]
MPRPILSRLVKPTLLASVGAVAITGCGLGSAGGFTPSGTLAGPLTEVKSLDGAELAVGSKNFTEQVLLGKITIILLKSAGADVEDLTNIPGSASARQAQLQNDIQLMWDYTGTAWITYLGQTDPIPDSTKQFEAVRDRDQTQNKLTWLPPAPMNNTYSFAVKDSVAKKYGLKSIADIMKVPAAERTFCVESEFAVRNDGFQPMLKTYGIKYGSDVRTNQIKQLDIGAIYAATDDGLCTFGEVFTTDGRIKALNLTVLDDTKKFFPNYNASLVVNDWVIKKYPQVQQLFAPVAKKLTNEQLIEMNRQVDVDGKAPADVAFDWLKKEGFID